MSFYPTFFDGMALGFFFGFLAFYLYVRYKLRRVKKPRNEIDRLVEDIHRYYRQVSKSKREDNE